MFHGLTPAQGERLLKILDEIGRMFGRVPEILQGHAPERVAFLHLDMNSADAESAALEFFFPRLAQGAYVLLDDYGWQTYREQKLVADEFFGDHGFRVLELPTGQGLVIL